MQIRFYPLFQFPSIIVIVLPLQPCAARLLYPHNSTSSTCGRDSDLSILLSKSVQTIVCYASPSVFHLLLSHRDALIIYLNNQRVNTFFANFSTFFITFLPAIIGACHRHTSEHIFDNSLSITAYQYSDIDRPISIKSYRYNYIDTGVSIRGV